MARAICQDPQILVLDEPTAYLDIKHKIELLDILRKMAQEKQVTVILSLHEIDLAAKLSDQLLCVQGQTIPAFGPPEEILERCPMEKLQVTVILSLHEIDLAAKLSDQLLCVQGQTIPAFGPPEEILERCPMEKLYDITRGSYNPLLGSVELVKPSGITRGSYNPLLGSVELVKPSGLPKVFVVGGGGWGIPVYRELQKRQIPFAAGILFENDVDYQVAARLSDQVGDGASRCIESCKKDRSPLRRGSYLKTMWIIRWRQGSAIRWSVPQPTAPWSSSCCKRRCSWQKAAAVSWMPERPWVR